MINPSCLTQGESRGRAPSRGRKGARAVERRMKAGRSARENVKDMKKRDGRRG